MELQTASYLLFLGLVVVVHAVLAPQWRLPLLLVASLFFYAMASTGYLVLLVALSSLNFWAAWHLSRGEGERGRSVVFGAIVVLNLAVLVLFKYLKHGVDALVAHAGWGGGGGQTAFHLAAPLGISYFTFQMVACVTDAYRRDWRLEGGWGRFVLFGLFFPQITSGPIPRAGQLLPQLAAGLSPTAEDRLAGLRLIAYGLFKKYVVANRLSDYVDQIFNGVTGSDTLHYTLLPTLLACVFNTLNLYADFSSYVDLARGSARLLGIRLELNFDDPFRSVSVTEFWRRWHITLATWLRDYLYMPLLIRIRNLGMTGVILAMMITFAICGVWHGATWTFLLFGVAQGVALSGETLTKRWRNKRLKQWPSDAVLVAGWLYTMGYFGFSQIFFRAANLSQAGQVFAGLVAFHLPRNAAELFALRGPFNFALDFVAVGVWLAVAWARRREHLVSTPRFVLVCAVCLLFLGHLGTGHFIYAGF